MTYNLEDFEKWLNEDESKTEELHQWEQTIKGLKELQKEHFKIENVLEWFVNGNVEERLEKENSVASRLENFIKHYWSSGGNTIQKEYLQKYQKVVKNFMSWVDQGGKEGELQRLQAELTILREKLTQHPQLLAEKETKIKELEQQLVQVNSDHSKQISALNQAKEISTKTFEQEVSQLETEISQHLTKVSDLEAQLNERTELLKWEQTENQEFRTKLTNLQKTQTTQQRSLKRQIQVKEEELQRTLTESKQSTATLRQEVENLKNKLAQSEKISQQELEVEQKKLVESEKKLTEQIEKNKVQQQTIQQLEANLKDSEKVLQETQEVLREAQAKITRLEAQLLSHEQLKEKYQQEKNDLTTEISQLTQQIREQEIKLTQQEIQSKEIAVDYQSQINNLEEKLTNTQTSLEKKVEFWKKEYHKSVRDKVKKKEPEPASDPPSLWVLGGIVLVGAIVLWTLEKKKK